MARVVRFHKTGGPEVLQIEEIDLPKPGLGEVQIRIHALGLNRAEAMFRSGKYVQESKLPGRPSYEAAEMAPSLLCSSQRERACPPA
jgi:NADPH:quinone reductase-like Zn-dependent oxidoreductase